MPDDNSLHIGISAGVEDLSKGLKKAGKEVDDFSKDVEKSAKKTEAVSTSSDKNTKSLKKLSTSLTDVNGGMKDLTRESGGLGDKLQGLSRVGSGVSGSMSGVASGALVATGAILAVAAAIGTALYFYGKHRAEAFDLELQYSKLNDRVKEYEKSLWGLNKTLLKGTQNGAKEIATLRTLRSGIEDVNSPMETRLSHLDSLKKKYPSLLQGISDEKLLTGQLASVYDTLTASILKSARAKAGLEALTENTKKLFALEAQLLENSIALNSKREQKRLLESRETAQEISTFQGGTNANLSKQSKLEDEINSKEKERTKILEDHKSIQAENAKLAKTISDNGGIIPIDYKVKGEIDDITDGVKETVKEAKKMEQTFFGKAYDQANLSGAFGETPDFVQQANEYSQFFSSVSGSLDAFNESMPDTLKTPRIDGEAINIDKAKLSNGLTDMMTSLEKFEQDFANLVAGAITETAVSIGENIGEALAKGENVISAIGTGLLNSMGMFLKEMGKLLITYGALAIAKGFIDIALSSGFGPVVIAAGAAAIVVGIALVAAGSAMSAKASGGEAGSTAGVGGGSSRRSSGSSVSSSGGGSGAGGTYVFEIEGTKLVGVLSNTLSRNRALGGSLGIT